MTNRNSSKRPGRPSHFRGRWARLRNAFGSTEKLAEALGASKNMVQKWALHGSGMTGPARVAISLRAKEMGVPNPLEPCEKCHGTGYRAPIGNEALKYRAGEVVPCEECQFDVPSSSPEGAVEDAEGM